MKTKKLRGEYVLIEPEMVEEITASGLKITKKPEQGDFTVGTIRVVGTGKRIEGAGYDELDISVGDKVLFRYGLKVKLNEQFLVLVNESDVVLILE